MNAKSICHGRDGNTLVFVLPFDSCVAMYMTGAIRVAEYIISAPELIDATRCDENVVNIFTLSPVLAPIREAAKAPTQRGSVESNTVKKSSLTASLKWIHWRSGSPSRIGISRIVFFNILRNSMLFPSVYVPVFCYLTYRPAGIIVSAAIIPML